MDSVMPPCEFSVHLLGVHFVPGKLLSIVDGILFYIGGTQANVKRAVLPLHLHQQAMEESHGGKYAGHFSGPKVCNTFVKHLVVERHVWSLLISTWCGSHVQAARAGRAARHTATTLLPQACLTPMKASIGPPPW